MKREETTFVCDNCEKESKPRSWSPDETKRVFPYDEGWVYLHSMNYQKLLGEETVSRIKFEDRHFCSPKCFLGHTANQFKEEAE